MIVVSGGFGRPLIADHILAAASLRWGAAAKGLDRSLRAGLRSVRYPIGSLIAGLGMRRIVGAEVILVVLSPPVTRTDAIQSFVCQETPLVTLTDDDGCQGTGYSYTIGAGGSSVVALLRDHILPQLIGRDPDAIESIWRDLMFGVHALSVGPILSLALAAVDTALWDLRGRRMGLPISRLLGGAHESLPAYTTEGGWLHLTTDQLVEEAMVAKSRGFAGSKLKIGKPSVAEDVNRLGAVREAVGPSFELMVDANQALRADGARRRAERLAPFDLAWIEEPLPADDIDGHAVLAASTSVPVAVGESLYSIGQFKDYLHAGACSVVQVDVARIGGITPWLKVAHTAEAYNVAVAPHFLMELHTSLACAVPNGVWVEYIPQLEPITSGGPEIRDGRAYPSTEPGLGISWDWDVIQRTRVGDDVHLGSVAGRRR